jgi:hypothetical protein
LEKVLDILEDIVHEEGEIDPFVHIQSDVIHAIIKVLEKENLAFIFGQSRNGILRNCLFIKKLLTGRAQF